MKLASPRKNRFIHPQKEALLIAPSLLGFALWYVVPLVSSMLNSFYANSADKQFVGWNNYLMVLDDRYFTLGMKNTFQFYLLVLFFSLTVGIGLSHITFSASHHGSELGNMVALLLLIPAFLPTSAVVPFAKVIMNLCIPLMQEWKLNATEWKYVVLVMIFIWKNIGAINLLLLIGMHSIAPEVFDAARIDGAPPRTILRCVTLPLMHPILLFAILYLSMNVLRIFRESYLLFGMYPPSTLYFVQNYVNSHFQRLDYGLLSSASTLFTITMFASFVLMALLFRHRKGDSV